MLGLVFFVLLCPGREEDVIPIVLLGFVGIGFGFSTFYYSVALLVDLVGPYNTWVHHSSNRPR